MFLFARMHASALDTAVPGVVKSITTSVAPSDSGRSPPPLTLLLADRTRTWCLRARATSSTTDPVLPRPRINKFILNLSSQFARESYLREIVLGYVYLVVRQTLPD